MLDKLAIVDVETTGMSAGRDRVIEIGIVLVDNNHVSKEWTTLVNPEKGVNPYIISMTGINPYELHKAPTFAQLRDEVWSYLEDRTLVAHNARFDYGFLKAEFNHLDQSYTPPQLCTVRLSRKLFPKTRGHGLDKIINRFGFEISNRHRALDDAQILWQFLQTVENMFGEQKVAQTIESLIKKPALPPQIESSLIQNLPECPGVYLFYDDKQTLLYVGKSIDIKSRVRSHFYDDIHSHKELQMKQRVCNIETITTAGELEALLLEAKLIKQLQPIYNHQLRRHRSLHTLQVKETSDGYRTAVYKATEDFSPEEVFSNIALFRTKRQMQSAVEKITKEHALCKKLMGLEKTSSSCFGYRLKTCLGACVGKEPIESYNQRFEKAFVDLQIPYWPYRDKVIISEQNEQTGQVSQLVFDKWCYLGKLDPETGELNQEEMTFDYDTYKILHLYLRKHKHIIQQISAIS